MNICRKCAQPQAIQDVDEFVSSFNRFAEIQYYITCSPMDHIPLTNLFENKKKKIHEILRLSCQRIYLNLNVFFASQLANSCYMFKAY